MADSYNDRRASEIVASRRGAIISVHDLRAALSAATKSGAR